MTRVTDHTDALARSSRATSGLRVGASAAFAFVFTMGIVNLFAGFADLALLLGARDSRAVSLRDDTR